MTERDSSVAGRPATSDMHQVGDPGALRSAPLPPGWDEGVRLEEDPATIPDRASVEVPPELRAEIERHMAKYPDYHSATLPALAAAQRVHGWCSPLALQQVAAVMQVTPAYLSSVATFYDMLRTEPLGSRYVYVCTSVSCHLRKAKDVYDAIAEEAREQGLEDVDLREFECLGACDMAPIASIEGRYVGPLSIGDARELVAEVKAGRQPFPGRGLGDPEALGAAAPAAPTGPPAEPETSPAGGTWKDPDAVEVPPVEPGARPPEPPEPRAPGTSHAGEDIDPASREEDRG